MAEREPYEEAEQRKYSILEKEFVESVLERAKEYLMQDDSFEPAIFLQFENQDRATIVLKGFPNSAAGRQACVASIGRSMKRAGKRIEEALFVSESWFVSRKKQEQFSPNLRPSEHPNRKEAIIIVGRNANRTGQTFVIQPFNRDIELLPVFIDKEIEEYNVPAGNNGVRGDGLVDYLFPPKIFSEQSGEKWDVMII